MLAIEKAPVDRRGLLAQPDEPCPRLFIITSHSLVRVHTFLRLLLGDGDIAVLRRAGAVALGVSLLLGWALVFEPRLTGLPAQRS